MRMILFAFILLCLLTSCSVKPNLSNVSNAETTKIVETSSVTTTSLTKKIKLSGTTKPAKVFPLMSSNSFPIKNIHVKAGQSVEKGDLLLSFDKSPLRNHISETKQEMKVIEQTLSQLTEKSNVESSSLSRIKDNLKESVNKSEQLLVGLNTGILNSSEIIKTTKEVAQKQNEITKAIDQLEKLPNMLELNEQLAHIKAELSATERILNTTKINTPINGVITEINAIEGLPVTRDTIIGKVVQLDPIHAEFKVTGKQVAQIKNNMPVWVNIDGFSTIYESKINSVSPIANKNTNLFTVTVPIKNTNQRIKGGMTVHATIPIKEVKDLPVIPEESVLYDNNQPYVFVVENNTAIRKNVTLGIKNDDMIQVVDSLSVGDKVVTVGKEELYDGMTVDLRD